MTRATATDKPVVILDPIPDAAAISGPAILLIPHKTLATVVRVLLSPLDPPALLSPLRTLRKRRRLVTVLVLVLLLLIRRLLAIIRRYYLSMTRKYKLLAAIFVI